MKFTVFSVALAALVSTNAFAADYLKSKKLREMACEQIEYFLDDEGLPLEYEADYRDTVVVFPDFHKLCSNAKNAFLVTKSVYNQKAKAVTELTVKVEFKMSGYLTIYGPITIKRSAFDPNTGEVKLGEWKYYGSDFGFELGPNSVRLLAEAMVNAADTHNGDADLRKFKAMDYTSTDAIKEMSAVVEEKNKETLEDARDYYSEEEIENGEAELCLMTDVDSDAESLFGSAEGIGSNGGQAFAIYELLRKKDWVYDVIGYQSEEWYEWCAFYTIQIFLKDGTVVILNYDFTT